MKITCYWFREIHSFVDLLLIVRIKKAIHLHISELWTTEGMTIKCFRATMYMRWFYLLVSTLQFRDYRNKVHVLIIMLPLKNYLMSLSLSANPPIRRANIPRLLRYWRLVLVHVDSENICETNHGKCSINWGYQNWVNYRMCDTSQSKVYAGTAERYL